MGSGTAIFYSRVVLRRELEKVDTMNIGNLQETTPENEGITASNGIAAQEVDAKRGRPKEGTKVLERRPERARKGRN